MLELILQWDREVFFFINTIYISSFFDWIMPLIRNRYFWAPLYLFIICYFLVNYKYRGFMVLIMLILTVTLSDQISSSLIKPFFEKLRPCQTTELAERIRILVDCGVGYSFVSSHAANHFAMAVFLTMLYFKKKKWIMPSAVLWAFSISYAQVYVGVHYPSDIIGGMLIGCLLGYLLGFLCKRFIFADYLIRET